jgi:hypothetical protein
MDTYIKFLIVSARFGVGMLCGTENIQSMFQFIPCASQHASGGESPVHGSLPADGALPYCGRTVRDCLDAA